MGCLNLINSSFLIFVIYILVSYSYHYLDSDITPNNSDSPTYQAVKMKAVLDEFYANNDENTYKNRKHFIGMVYLFYVNFIFYILF